MIADILGWTPGLREVLIVLIVFAVPVILVVLFIKAISRNKKENAKLRLELDKIKGQGFAESAGETIHGTYSIAAPIFGRSGRIIAALSVSAPRHRLGDKKTQKRMTLLIVKAAKDISNKVATVEGV